MLVSTATLGGHVDTIGSQPSASWACSESFVDRVLGENDFVPSIADSLRTPAHGSAAATAHAGPSFPKQGN